jgi:hypothetical protein
MRRKTSRQALYGPQKQLNLKSQLFGLLRDELGLGRQPKIAQLLCDDIAAVVEECYVTEDQLRIGQLLILAPEKGQSNGFRAGLDRVKMRPVKLTLLTPEDIEDLANGTDHTEVRMKRIARMVKEAFEQGACLSTIQLGVLVGIHPGVVAEQVRRYHDTHEELLPLRGIVEDCSPATSHKELIVKLHLSGMTTSEISQKTNHTPKSVERYLRRFNQVRELVHHLHDAPEPVVVARILAISETLARAYLALIPDDELPAA